MSQKSTKYIVQLLQIVLFAGVVYWLIKDLDGSTFKQTIQSASVLPLLIALLIYFLRFAIYGIRWSLIAKAHEVLLKQWFYIKTSFEILFLELIMPLPGIEDVLRVVEMHVEDVPKSKGSMIVFMDRLTGLAGLSLLLPFTLIALSGEVLAGSKQLVLVVVVSLALLLIMDMLYKRWSLGIVLKVLTSVNISFIPAKLIERLRQLQQLRLSTHHLLANLVVTILYQLSSAVIIYFLFLGINYPIPLADIVIVLPLFYFSAVLPLSVQGLGLFEAAMLFTFPLIGVPFEAVSAVAILHFAIHLLLILSSGGYFVLYGQKRLIHYKELIQKIRKEGITSEN